MTAAVMNVSMAVRMMTGVMRMVTTAVVRPC